MILHRCLFVAAAMVSLSITDATARGQTSDRSVNIIMEDQFRNRRETGAFRGDVVVLVYAERKGAEAALDLGRKLHLLFHPTAAQVSL